jgi:hypothetical protein
LIHLSFSRKDFFFEETAEKKLQLESLNGTCELVGHRPARRQGRNYAKAPL